MAKTFEERLANISNPTALKLLTTIIKKRSNLAVAADLTTSQELIEIASTLGPYICCLKTHIDILSDWTPEVSSELVRLAKVHDFVLFEDRKFADIGHTVNMYFLMPIYQ